MTQRPRNHAFLWLVLFVALASFGGALFKYRVDLYEIYFRWRQGPIPAPVSREEYIVAVLEEAMLGDADDAEPIPSADEARKVEPQPDDSRPPLHTDDLPATTERSVIQESEEAETIPEVLNLRLPFVVQAPKGEWDALHEDACEEASLIMLQAYLTDEPAIGVAAADERITAMVGHEEEELGFGISITAEQVETLFEDFYGVDRLSVIPFDSIETLKREIARGYPVIIPAHGKSLENPFFSNGGPDYHMLVAKGYTTTHIITHDPGTKRGADFLYAYENLFAAAHDWNGGDVLNGEKVLIVVR